MSLVAGTLPYMCPEQLEGKNADARADIFSYGAVLFEMVTGRRAFEAQNRERLISAIRSAPYRPGTLTPSSLDAVVQTCLAKDPDNRWSNMHDVRLQLQGVLQDAEAPAVGNRAHRPTKCRPLAARDAVGPRRGLRSRWILPATGSVTYSAPPGPMVLPEPPARPPASSTAAGPSTRAGPLAARQRVHRDQDPANNRSFRSQPIGTSCSVRRPPWPRPYSAKQLEPSPPGSPW